MVRASITSAALLTLGHPCSASDPTCSTTVHLRRAVSGAYYALFRELVGEATRRAVGPERSRQHDRSPLARWYAHGEIRTVSQWVERVTGIEPALSVRESGVRRRPASF